MDPSIASNIETLIDAKKIWETEYLPIEVQVQDEEEGAEGATHKVNLADFIGTGIRGNRDRNCKELRQYLPNGFNMNTSSFRREQLIPFIANACAQSGFTVSTKGWEKKWQKIRFFCQHSRVHDDRTKGAPDDGLSSAHSAMLLSENTEMDVSNNGRPPDALTQNTAPQRWTKRIRPSPANNELRCPFGFSLYWDGDSDTEQDCAGLWYFCADGTGCKSHRGHLKKNPIDVKLSYRSVPPSEIEYAQQTMALNAETAIVQALIEKRTGITLSHDQLRHCASRTSPESGELDSITASSAGVPMHHSPAERLVDYLRKEQSLDFILLIHENTATKLLTIARTGKNRAGSSEQNAYCPNDTDADTLSYAESIRKSLGLSGNTKLLLGAAWVSHQQQRMFSMFPETLCADVTMGTNAEKRPRLV